ncbi:MAG: hypothetical protein GY853_01455 [PVC group bacterium]|nr:hypothetical protein [PVC group bacterium]
MEKCSRCKRRKIEYELETPFQDEKIFLCKDCYILVWELLSKWLNVYGWHSKLLKFEEKINQAILSGIKEIPMKGKRKKSVDPKKYFLAYFDEDYDDEEKGGWEVGSLMSEDLDHIKKIYDKVSEHHPCRICATIYG